MPENSMILGEDFLVPDAVPRGILTQKDREFLIGMLELEGKQESDRRYRIRERVSNSFYDYPFLAYHLYDEDIEQIFQSQDMESTGPTDKIESALLFLYSGIKTTDRDFEELLYNTVRTYERRNNPDKLSHLDIKVNVDRASPDIEEVFLRFESGEATLDDFNYLLRNFGEDAIRRLDENFDEDEASIRIEDSDTEEPSSIPLNRLISTIKESMSAEEENNDS